MQHFCEEVEDIANKTVRFIEEKKHTMYNEILSQEKILKASFTRSQALQELVCKLVDDYVEDIQQSVLHHHRDSIFENKIKDKNRKMNDQACLDLHQMFEEEIQTQLKHPFLIKKLIAKDEELHESLQMKINEVINDLEKWKKSYNAENDHKAKCIKENYSITKAQCENDTKNNDRERRIEYLNNQNKKFKKELSIANKDLERSTEDLKTSNEKLDRYKIKAHKLSSELKDLAAKYSSLCQEHKEDFLR